MSNKHKATEAFKIMTYKCEKCGYQERIWNSRDGVTPFGIACVKCNGIENHSYFGDDEYAPDYIPFHGMRIFVDHDYNSAEKAAIKRINNLNGSTYEVVKEEYDNVLKNIIDQILGDHCSVNVVIVERPFDSDGYKIAKDDNKSDSDKKKEFMDTVERMKVEMVNRLEKYGEPNDLKLHERLNVENMEIVKVHGGFIYNQTFEGDNYTKNEEFDIITSTFVQSNV